MALNFPANPTAGDIYQTSNTVWQFDGSFWNILSNNPNALQILSNIDKQTNSPDTTAGLVLTSVGDTTYDFQPQINNFTQLQDIDLVTNDPLNTLDQFMTTDGAGGFKFVPIVDTLANLQDVDSVTNNPLGVSGRILQSNGSGGFSFSLISLSQVTNVDLSTNNPNNATDLVLTSAGSGEFLFKSLDNISSNLLSTGDIDQVNGVFGFDQNLNDFVGAFTLPTSNANNGFFYNNNGTVSLTTNIFTALGGWVISTNFNGDLIFSYNTVNMIAFRTNGAIDAKDDITAFVGTIV
jgi:hypothetical protein